MLDLTFDLVLGLPWLAAVNPRLDWKERTLAVQVKGRWVKLPTIASTEFAEMSKAFKEPASCVKGVREGGDVGAEGMDWARAKECLATVST